ncbi:hypothetical protein [Treponema sp. R80B11-R83G3]
MNRTNRSCQKYTADQWVECGKVILENIEGGKVTLFQLLALVEMARNIEVEP